MMKPPTIGEKLDISRKRRSSTIEERE